MRQFQDLYLCDPGKAVTCGKHACYTNSGPCYATTNPDHAHCKNDELILIMSKEQQERIYKEGLNLADHLEIATKLAIGHYNAN